MRVIKLGLYFFIFLLKYNKFNFICEIINISSGRIFPHGGGLIPIPILKVTAGRLLPLFPSPQEKILTFGSPIYRYLHEYHHLWILIAIPSRGCIVQRLVRFPPELAPRKPKKTKIKFLTIALVNIPKAHVPKKANSQRPKKPNNFFETPIASHTNKPINHGPKKHNQSQKPNNSKSKL